MADGTVVVVGGTAGLGRDIAQSYADRGRPVVISRRDAARGESVAAEVGGAACGVGLDLTALHDIAECLTDIGAVDHLVLSAIARDANSVHAYEVDRPVELVTTPTTFRRDARSRPARAPFSWGVRNSALSRVPFGHR